jgi:hypothetical protein
MGLKRNDDRPGRRVVYHYAAEPDFAKILAEEAGKYAYNEAKGGSQEPDKMALLGKTLPLLLPFYARRFRVDH